MSSPYEVRISGRAERDLVRLAEKSGVACLGFVFGPLAEQPHRVGGALSGPLAGLCFARRGSYRIIYRVDDELRRVDIVHIDHRGDVYR